MNRTSAGFRRPLLSGLAVAVAIAIAGGAGEYAVRLAQPELDPTRHLRFEKGQGDVPVLGPRDTEQRQIKNTGDFNVAVRFNRHGLRDSKDLAGGTDDDVYLVGDSFTFGWGVTEDQSVSERLAALIERRVFNLSMPTGIDGYDALLRYAEANGARVRNVIIAVSMETDLQIYDSNAPTADAVMAVAAAGNELQWLKVYLTNHSALYLLATTLIHRSSALRDLAVRSGLLISNIEGVRQFEFSERVIESSARRLADIARRYRTTVVVLPSRALWAGPRQKEENRRHVTFVRRVEQLGFAVVDLKPVFEEGGNPLAYHFANDPHWKPSGHALAANALAGRLRAQLNHP